MLCANWRALDLLSPVLFTTAVVAAEDHGQTRNISAATPVAISVGPAEQASDPPHRAQVRLAAPDYLVAPAAVAVASDLPEPQRAHRRWALAPQSGQRRRSDGHRPGGRGPGSTGTAAGQPGAPAPAAARRRRFGWSWPGCRRPRGRRRPHRGPEWPRPAGCLGAPRPGCARWSARPAPAASRARWRTQGPGRPGALRPPARCRRPGRPAPCSWVLLRARAILSSDLGHRNPGATTRIRQRGQGALAAACSTR